MRVNPTYDPTTTSANLTQERLPRRADAHQRAARQHLEDAAALTNWYNRLVFRYSVELFLPDSTLMLFRDAKKVADSIVKALAH